MIINYLKIAWRTVCKQKFYTGINVFGLAMGIGCSTILFLFISFHLSFDQFHAHPKRIFRAVTELHIPDGSVDYDPGSPYILGGLLTRFPAVENQTTLLNKRSFTVSVPQKSPGKNSLFYEFENIAFTDSNWFKMFTYRFKSGNVGTALGNPFTAIITSGLAKKYYNTDEVIGKTIRIENKYSFLITGVLQDNPANTDFQENLFLSISSAKTMFPEPADFWTKLDFISSKVNVFVLLKNDDAQKQIDKGIKQILSTDFKDCKYLSFHLQPLADIHFNSRYGGKISKPLLLVLGLIAFALILIACVNFINMATAQSLTRAKEIGIRKVLGSSRRAVFWQFISETALVTLAAGALAFTAVMLFLPALDNWLQLPLAVNGLSLIFLVVLLIVIVFAAGFYPAVILSGFKPADTLKSKTGGHYVSSRFSRNALIVFQNVIAQALIVCTVIIVLQVKFLKSADLGFNKDAVIMLPVPEHTEGKLSFLQNQLLKHPGIKSLSFCYKPPSALTQKGGSIRFDGREWEKFTVNSIIGDSHYLKTFGLKLIAGRDFYAADTANAYIVNQQMLKELNLRNTEQAIGHQLTAGDFGDKPGTIIGVVKDFNVQPLSATLQPLLIAPKPEYYENVAVKISGNHHQEIIEIIRQEWQKTFPQNAFEYHFLDEQLARFYQKEEMIGKLITVGTIVAILISCLGLLGLVSLMTVQRTKEIGIRKVLGATVAQITAMLSNHFLKLILLAQIVATPLAYFIMQKWLQDFAYRIQISWWIFAFSGISAVLISLITISFQSVKSALANPVKSLRSE